MTHTHTHTHLLGLLWTRDRHVAETSDNTQRSQETDVHALGGIRTRNNSMLTAVDQSLKPRCYRNRPVLFSPPINSFPLLTLIQQTVA